LRSRYGPDYPDVLAKAAEIKAAEQKLDELRKQAQSSKAAEEKPRNPAIAGQLADLDEEIRKHQVRQSELDSQIKFHESAMQRAPAAQQELTIATNDVASASDRYKRLEDRKFGADMSSDVESQQQAERFVLLEPAPPPQKPVSPNRVMFDSAGAGAGLLLALVLVLALELMDRTVKTESEVADLIKAPVYGHIPRLASQRVRRKRRVWTAIAATGNVALALGYAGLLFIALK